MYLRRYTLPHVWSFYFCWNQGSVQSHMAFRTIFRTVFRIDASPQPLVYIPSKEVCAHFALTVSNYSSSICTYPSSLSHTLRPSPTFARLSYPLLLYHTRRTTDHFPARSISFLYLQAFFFLASTASTTPFIAMRNNTNARSRHKKSTCGESL